MPGRVSAWGVYDVFTVKDGGQIFLAVVSDSQWATFCRAFGLAELQADARLATNGDRVRARDWLLPLLREHLASRSAAEIGAVFEAQGLPYAPITRPHELFDDPHLAAGGGLAEVDIPADASGAARPLHVRMPLLPLALDGVRLPVRAGPPAIGEHGDALLAELGYDAAAIGELRAAGVLGAAPARDG
jgi:crotonobetainyl-CoA:carnitine CoA-transferase CaiB-like acyl-CoA transferase